MKLLVVVERTGTGYSAFVPDLPGCVASGRTRPEVEASMRDAIASHLDELRAAGEPPPVPRAYVTVVEVAA